jgi:ubiquinone/menaquinone biosynthesis C-methylase UbiE
MSDRGHPIFAAWYDRMARGAEKRGLAELRRQVLAPATGHVLEIGAGTGLNFGHYPTAVTDVLATEPDPNMLQRARKAIAAASVPLKLERAAAQELPAEDGTIDTVVATLVFCTIPNPPAALSEIKRVLKPDGRLLFLEHVRADTPGLARWQDRLQPIWSVFGAGCHPNRDTPATFERAGFTFDELVRFPFTPNLVLDKPHTRGIARPA